MVRVTGAGKLRRGVSAVVVLGLVSLALAGGAGRASAAPGRGAARVPRAGSASAGRISTVVGGVGGPARATKVGIGPCGDGNSGNSGDGGPGTSASVSPSDAALDPAGNLVVAALGRVRVVAVSTGTFYGVAMTAGDIYTVAGNGIPGYSGDGGPATSAEVAAGAGILVTRTGSLLFASGHRVRMVTGGPTAATSARS